MKVAISGSRKLASGDEAIIRLAIARLLSRGPDEILFGGAKGVDTVALDAAFSDRGEAKLPRLTVIVPARGSDPPREARDCTRRCADEIVELGLPPRLLASYHQRNRALVDRADELLALWDGQSSGTRQTIAYARSRRMPVEIVRLLGAGPASLELFGRGSDRS